MSSDTMSKSNSSPLRRALTIDWAPESSQTVRCTTACTPFNRGRQLRLRESQPPAISVRFLSPQPNGPHWEMPWEGSQTLTWVGQVDLLGDSAGILWDSMDSQGEKEEQTATGPAGTKGAHSGVRGREGKGMGARVDQIRSGTEGGPGRIENGGRSGNVTRRKAGWKGGLQGDDNPDAGEQTNKNDHYHGSASL